MRSSSTRISRSQIDAWFSAIRSECPDIPTELVYETPFQLVMAVMLSAQTTDRQVNRITPPLFARVKTPGDMLALSLEALTEYVRSVNYYKTKAKHIHESARMLHEEHAGKIPNDMPALRRLPGIGVKTAKVILSVLYDAPYVGVDTHVHRVANRLGLVSTRTPDETDRVLDEMLTDEQKRRIHHPLVLFGRYRCTARNPRCHDCPLRRTCRYFREKNRDTSGE